MIVQVRRNVVFAKNDVDEGSNVGNADLSVHVDIALKEFEHAGEQR